MSNSTAYIFDVDGTLTPSRGKMNEEFSRFILSLCVLQDVYLVTGSDKDKTIEQVGDIIWNKTKRNYQCGGNDVWSKGENIHSNEWILHWEPRKWLNYQLMRSNWFPKNGSHFDDRPGMLNFSIPGRKIDLEFRKKYVEYDLISNERTRLAKEFNELFSEQYNVMATVGGETGLDISPIGCDKAQILKDFENTDIVFFGDKMAPGGNDFPLAQAILDRSNLNDILFPVNSWEDTYEILKEHKYD